MARRLSPRSLAVLRALAADPETWRFGYDLATELRMPTGSLYPMLTRLTERGLLEATWETDPPPGRPPRHLYRVSQAGWELSASE